MRTGLIVLIVVLFTVVMFSLPIILASNVQSDSSITAYSEQFPVTVDPKNRVIVENADVNTFFENQNSPLQAATGNMAEIFSSVFDWVAIAISEIPFYQSIAGVDGRFVKITAGMRKEQVANAFAKVLSWSAIQKKEFLTARPDESLPLIEGSFSPGVYLVTPNTTPIEAQALVNERFYNDILSRYSETIAQIVPLEQALSIASMIEREAGGADDRRLISGIIWNRLFINMPLQIDATLQYAKANSVKGAGWWPKVVPPRDISRKSPYNTYLNKGLPPTPISNPSVASVLAALNPRNTSCIFYFHDSARRFHCSQTYAEHVALLKKYFGRGK